MNQVRLRHTILRGKRSTFLQSAAKGFIALAGRNARLAGRPLLSLTAAAVVLGVPTVSQAHTDALGYIITAGSAAGLNNAAIVYGTYHAGNVAPEGQLLLKRSDGTDVGTQAFSILLSTTTNGVVPTGLVAGSNYFFVANGSGALSPTNNTGQPVYNFQSANFNDLSAGTYSFGYATTTGLSAVWTPFGPAVSAGTFSITGSGGVIVVGVTPNIDTAKPSYASSGLGSVVNPAFTGGILAIDQANATYVQNFTLDKSATNTIDTSGNTTTFTGVFTNAVAQSGGLIIKDATGAGTVTMLGHSTYTGGTTVNNGTLAIGASGTLGDATGTTTINGGTLLIGSSVQSQAALNQTNGTISNGTLVVNAYSLQGGTLDSTATVNAGTSYNLYGGSVNGVLNGAAAANVNGPGTVVFSGQNGYTGGTFVNGGKLLLTAAGTLGDVNSFTTVNAGSLDLGGTAQSQVTVSQYGGSVSNGTLLVTSYDLFGGLLSADVGVNASLVFNLVNGTVNGTLGGTGALYKFGTGTVTLNSQNTYTGGTVIQSGTLVLAGLGTLGDINGTTRIDTGTLDLGGTVQSQATLTQNDGTVTNGILNGTDYKLVNGTLDGTATINATTGISLAAGTINGMLGGTATLHKVTIGGAVLAGVNSYLGGTIVDGGVLLLAGAGTLGDINGTTVVGAATIDLGGTVQAQSSLTQNLGSTVTNGAMNVATYNLIGGLLDTSAIVNATTSFAVADGTVNGVLAGTGALDKTTTETVTLGNLNTYLGGTSVDGGTLAITGVGTLGDANGTTTVNAGTLDLGGTAQNQTTLNQNDGLITNGTINVTSYNLNGGTLDSNATVIANAAILVPIVRANTFASRFRVISFGPQGGFNLAAGTVNGTLSGSAAVDKITDGVVTLAGVNSYTGGTTVDGGTLVLAGVGTLGAITNATTVNAATLDLGGTTQTQSALIQTNGLITNGTVIADSYNMTGGTLDDNATVSATTSFALATGTVNGVLTGTAGLDKSGQGTVILAGLNDFTGGTTLDAGTILIDESGTLGAATGITTVNAGTLDFAGTVQTQATLNQSAGTVTNGTISVGNYNLAGGTLDSTGTVNAVTAFNLVGGAVNGVLTGTGALDKIGTGTVTLAAVNGFTGGTTVDSGTLLLAGAGTLGAVTNTTTVNAATLDLGGTVQTQSVLNQTSGTVTNGTVHVGNYNLAGGTLDSTATVSAMTAFNLTGGAVNGMLTGAGALDKVGSGKVILAGLNGYTGGTTVDGGTLAIDENGTLGAVTGTTTVNAGTLDFAGTVQTQAALIQTGGTVANGPINVGSYGMTGGTLDASATVNASTGFNLKAGTVNGTLTGIGALNKTGTGLVTLAGVNGYTGGTTISGGTLMLGNGGTTGSILGNVTNKGVLAFNHSDAILFFATVSGAGGVAQVGTGKTTLAALNTYQGGTLVAAGTLAGSATSFGSGGILNNSALVLNQSTDANFVNAVQGTGSFTKTGSGTLNLVADSSLSGRTTLDAGGLAVNANFHNSAYTAASGTTVSGTGTVGGLVVGSGATLAPGNNGLGTLTVNGNLTQQAGSVFQVQLATTGATDAVVVSGTAQIAAGATLTVTKLDNKPYSVNSSYNVLTANGGVTGTYVLSGDTHISAFFDLLAHYDADHVTLSATQTHSFVTLSGTQNQTAAASALQSLGTNNLIFDAGGLFTTQAAAQNAFDQLSGEVHSSAKTATIEDSRLIREATILRLRGEAAVRPNGMTLWGHAYGSQGHWSGTTDNNASQLHRSIDGFLIGTDGAIGDTLRVGALGGYSNTKLRVSGRNSTGTSDTIQAGVYGGGQIGAVDIRLGASYAWHDLDTARQVAFTGFSDSLKARYHARTAQAFGGFGYRIDVNHGALEPFADIAYVNLHTDAFTETGGAAALASASNSASVTFATLGLRMKKDLNAAGSTNVYGAMGWRGAFGDVTPSSTLHFASGGSVLDVIGTPIAHSAAVLEAGVETAMTKRLSLSASYSGQLSSGVNDQGFKATLGWKF